MDKSWTGRVSKAEERIAVIKPVKPIRIKPVHVPTPQCCVEVKWPDNDWRRERYKKLRPTFDPDHCQHESSFDIDGNLYCKLHAGQVALDKWVRGLLVAVEVLPRATAEKSGFIACSHPMKYRTQGGYDGKAIKRYPLRYGSAEVEICKACDGWQLNVHSPGKWRAGPYEDAYNECIKQQEDEC
jgi:hypothetical protein